jgi:hypothetical protein
MAAAELATAQGVLNFVVTGNVRSGTAVVQTTLSKRAGVVCHSEVFHPDKDARKEAHASYFGSAGPNRSPGHFVEGLVSPCQYLAHSVLDNPVNGEQAVGVKLCYRDVARFELAEFFASRCREGDFCLVHVTRNPVACFVSLKQATRTGLWTRPAGSPPGPSPRPETLDPDELVAFCREHEATAARVRASCEDILEVAYRDLCLDYAATMYRVFDFLELPASPRRPSPGCLRLANLPMPRRINDLARLRTRLPSDVRGLLDAEDLF